MENVVLNNIHSMVALLVSFADVVQWRNAATEGLLAVSN